MLWTKYLFKFWRVINKCIAHFKWNDNNNNHLGCYAYQFKLYYYFFLIILFMNELQLQITLKFKAYIKRLFAIMMIILKWVYVL